MKLLFDRNREEVEDLIGKTILEENKDREIITDINKPINMLIEGDNLLSLNHLLDTHKNLVNLIYIDPPYRTQNKNFRYNDYFKTHDEWLSFMEKRLILAKELLSDDGVVFISIDDNELAQLKLLCDEIFEDCNNLGIIIQDKGNSQNDALNIQKNHEYILAYTKSKTYSNKKEKALLYRNELEKKQVYIDVNNRFYIRGSELVSGQSNSDLNNHPLCGYTVYYNERLDDKIAVQDYNIQLAKTSNNENDVYFKPDENLIKNGYIVIRPKKRNKKLGRWTWSLEKFNKEKDSIEVFKTKTGYSLRKKIYVSASDIFKENNKNFIYKEKKVNSRSIIKYSTSEGTLLLNQFFNENVFNNPKNLSMIKYLINLKTSENKSCIILDFFAGSGTTGHAVLELNKEDNGKRQFILCTNNENNICEEVTYQRLNKVINGYTIPKGKEVEGLGGNLKYYKVVEK